MEIYGAAVADKLDNSRGILNRRYYRQVKELLKLNIKFGFSKFNFKYISFHFFFSIVH